MEIARVRLGLASGCVFDALHQVVDLGKLAFQFCGFLFQFGFKPCTSVRCVIDVTRSVLKFLRNPTRGILELWKTSLSRCLSKGSDCLIENHSLRLMSAFESR
jgi:hypothetical protein